LVACFDLCAPERLLAVAVVTAGRAGVEWRFFAPSLGQQQDIRDIEQ
jgi:hypothetical protein